MNETVSQIIQALSKAQGEFGHITRDKTVTVSTRTGGTYKFSYAPLETIMAAIRKPLADNGLAIIQTVIHKEDGDFTSTTLLHASGESLPSCDIPILTKEPGPQAYGSGLTYSRRYGITLLLCICADDDDDANAAEGNKAAVTKEPVTFTKPAQPELPVSEFITPDQAQRLHKRFRESLREELRDKADLLLYDFLKFTGYKREDGSTSALLIPAELFAEIGKASVKHAKEL